MVTNTKNELNREQIKILENILDENSPDQIYQKLALHKLEEEDFDGAIATAEKIRNWSIKLQTFESMQSKVSDLMTKEKILDLMPMRDFYVRDEIYKKYAMEKIANNDFEGAYKITGKMSVWTSKVDEVLLAIIEKTPDLEFAQKVAEESQYNIKTLKTIFDRLLARIDTFLEKNDFSGAIEFVSSTRDSINKDRLFSKVFQKIEENGFDEDNLKLIEGVIDQLEPMTQKTMLQKLVTQYTLLGNTEAAAKPTKKLEEIAKKEAELLQSIMKFRSYSSMIFPVIGSIFGLYNGIKCVLSKEFSPLGVFGTVAATSLVGLLTGEIFNTTIGSPFEHTTDCLIDLVHQGKVKLNK